MMSAEPPGRCRWCRYADMWHRVIEHEAYCPIRRPRDFLYYGTPSTAQIRAVEARELGSRARRLSEQLGVWLGAPLAEPTPLDSTPAEVVEWMRAAREILEEVAAEEEPEPCTECGSLIAYSHGRGCSLA